MSDNDLVMRGAVVVEKPRPLKLHHRFTAPAEACLTIGGINVWSDGHLTDDECELLASWLTQAVA